MLDVKRLIYLHGSETDSNSGKARQFRGWFPGMLTPDLKRSFDERMSLLYSILSNKTDWTLISFCYGGLMGTVFTLDHPTHVRKLILLAPALTLGSFSSRSDLEPVSVPTIVVHGTLDSVVPLEPVREVVQKLFASVKYYVVEDDHPLHKSVQELDWNSILE
jgi:pimeloyl-ACP methyl ester carboxylesterase